MNFPSIQLKLQSLGEEVRSMKRVLRWLIVGLTGTLCAMPATAAENDWPSKAITFLQPYGPGTALDAVTRHIAGQLSAQWKVPIVVVNRAGANGLIGTEAAARSAPDGYTFLFTGPGHFTNELLISKVPFDAVKDFTPVARIASVMLVLMVPRASPFNSVRELVGYAKSNPGKLSYASGGSGSSQHLSAASFLAQAGISALHVPYKTQAQALTDTVGGQVSFSFAAMATAAGQFKGGKIKALAVSGPRRSQTLPEVPTLAESGLPGYEFFSFNAIFVPAGTPEGIVRKFSDALGPIVRSPEFEALIRAQMIESDFADSREWAAAIPAEKNRWTELVRTSGARKE
jgi:tripartite-type tricarboxylate transporter receptor subunit TctC